MFRLALLLALLSRIQAFVALQTLLTNPRAPHGLDSPLNAPRAPRCVGFRSGYRGLVAAAATPPEITAFVQHLQAIRKLPRVANNESTIPTASSNYLSNICRQDKPTFRRLFTHDLGGSGNYCQTISSRQDSDF